MVFAGRQDNGCARRAHSGRTPGVVGVWQMCGRCRGPWARRVRTLLTVGVPIVYTTIALPPPADRSLSDVWSALGGELKPSLDLVVSAPLAVRREEAAAAPVLEERLRLGASDGGTDGLVRVSPRRKP